MKLISFLIVSLSIIFPLVVNAKPTLEVDLELQTSLERYQQLRDRSLLLQPCVENLRDDLRPLLLEFSEWVVEIFGRVERIIELRRTCDSIEMSDPPTRWELIQRESCELRFHGSIVFEVTRLTYEINQKLQSYPIIVRESIQNFLECIEYEVPEFNEFQPRPSLNRD